MKKVLGLGIIIILFTGMAAWARVGGGDVTFKTRGAAPVVFNHDSHVSAGKLQCTDCHASLYVTHEKHKKTTMVQMRQGKSCGACHNGKKAFDVKVNCNSCHKK